MYFKIALAALQLAEVILSWLREKQQLDAGADREIARASASILSKTQIGKSIDLRAAGLGEAQVDQELKDLEPK